MEHESATVAGEHIDVVVDERPPAAVEEEGEQEEATHSMFPSRRLTPKDLRRNTLRLADGREVKSMQDLKLYEMEKDSPWVNHVIGDWELVDDFVVSWRTCDR
jgi:hypothetical protein